MGDSAIEWTEKTWNPVTGCSKVSPGCANCYAETLTKRFPDRFYPDGTFRPWTPQNADRNVVLHPDRLDQPLRWRKPSMVFVNSMSDLFHEQVPDGFIEDVLGVMLEAKQHIFQVLTKRPERMRDFLSAQIAGTRGPRNVWWGVSIENRRFVHRADHLRETPAAVRFISAEPLLGPLVIPTYLGLAPRDEFVPFWPDGFDGPELDLTGIDWCIVGGESGPGARPMRLEWVRDLIAAARAADTAPFVKQLGRELGRELGAGSKGGDIDCWPEDLRVREMPRADLPARSEAHV